MGAALWRTCFADRVGRSSLPSSRPSLNEGRCRREIRQHPGQGPRARLRGRAADRARPRRRPLRAAGWPQLAAGDRPHGGRPYEAVALEVMRPFLGGEVSDHELSAIIEEAYGTFRHRTVTPLVQIGPSDWMLELFHGPTLAFKDVAMQVLARLMDRTLVAARRAGDHRRRHLGRHGRRGHRRLPRPRGASTSSSCIRTAASATCSGGR